MNKLLLNVSVLGFLLSLLFCMSYGYFGNDLKPSDHCLCKLKGALDDCSCSVDTVDYYNNMKISPRLQSLLQKDYFRFYKVNLKNECPFWSDDSRCAIKYCHVQPSSEENLPAGLKGKSEKIPLPIEASEKKNSDHGNSADCSGNIDTPENKYSDQGNSADCNENTDLGHLNTTISASTYEEFARWKAYDDAMDNYCVIADDDAGAEYVDLTLNPERYTGYKGESANRIWNSIYMENCFRPKTSYYSYIDTAQLSGMCLEKRVFYRVLSGLHSSINIHLCANYLQNDKVCFGPVAPDGVWGPNLEEFKRRFDPTTTGGEGPQWLRNIYFVYLLELRALQKATPYLRREEYFTGNSEEDAEVRTAMEDFLNIVDTFPNHFDESCMFNGGGKETRKLKEEFRQHFRNISRIMDCVGCEKCKLWGKLQVHGLGTALKILFSGKFDRAVNSRNNVTKNNFQLQRSEIVALINGFGRLSASILELEHFRSMMSSPPPCSAGKYELWCIASCMLCNKDDVRVGCGAETTSAPTGKTWYARRK